MPRSDVTIFYSSSAPANAFVGGAEMLGRTGGVTAPGTANPIDVDIFGAKIFGQSGSVADVIAPSVLRAAGYLLVDDFGADPDGVDDSITAINNCILQAKDDAKSIWFTEGATYSVSSTVRCFKWDKNIDPNAFAPTLSPQCYGGGSGATRPKIVLRDGASGFSNANDARPVVVYRMFQLSGEGVEPADVLDDTGIFVSQSNNLFYATWQNIDIDCGNNPGAFGMYFPAAQRCFAADVTIDATQAAGGWWGLLGRNSCVMNLKVIGGVEQVIDSIGITADGNAGCMLAGLTLIPDNRTTVPIQHDDLVPLVLVGFDFQSNGFTGDWFQMQAFGAAANGQVCMMHGIVDGGNRIIDNAAGKNLYARNIYATNVNSLVQSGSENVISGTGTWQRLAEYSYTDQSTSLYPSESILQGVKNSNAQRIVDVESSITPPTRNYVSDHTIDIHRIDTDLYEDVTAPEHGAISGPELFATGAYRDDFNHDTTTPDSLAAFQSAIAAAEAAGHNRV